MRELTKETGGRHEESRDLPLTDFEKFETLRDMQRNETSRVFQLAHLSCETESTVDIGQSRQIGKSR